MLQKIQLFILRELALPLARRLGTGFAVWLMAFGVPEDTVQAFVKASLALAAVAFDLFASSRDRSERKD